MCTLLVNTWFFFRAAAVVTAVIAIIYVVIALAALWVCATFTSMFPPAVIGCFVAIAFLIGAVAAAGMALVLFAISEGVRVLAVIACATPAPVPPSP